MIGFGSKILQVFLKYFASTFLWEENPIHRHFIAIVKNNILIELLVF